MDELVNFRFYAGIAIAFGLIIAAVGGWYWREYNNEISSFRHNETQDNIGQLGETLKEKNTESSRKIDGLEKRLTDGQTDLGEKIDVLPKKMEYKNPLPKIVGEILMGVRNAGEIKNFGRKSEIPNRHKDRMKSWNELASKNNLEHLLIPLKITNTGDYIITDISFRVHYKTPTYIVGEGADNVPVNKVRNFPAHYQITSGKIDKKRFEPIHWQTARFVYDDFKISSLKPNETIEFSIKRISERNFLKSPKIEILFKDFQGNNWRKINDENPKLIG